MSTNPIQLPEQVKSGRSRYIWASIVALGLNFFVIPAFLYPTGPKSHYSIEGTVLAVLAGVTGCYGFFGFPRRPVLVKVGIGLVCIFSTVIAIFAVIRFIRFGQIQ